MKNTYYCPELTKDTDIAPIVRSALLSMPGVEAVLVEQSHGGVTVTFQSPVEHKHLMNQLWGLGLPVARTITEEQVPAVILEEEPND